MAKSFKDAIKNTQKAIAAATARGINRGLSAGRTEMSKRLKKDTGLSAQLLKKRIGLLPAQQSRALGWLYVGFKQGFNVEEFKAKEKIIKVRPRINRSTRGRPKNRSYRGTTVKVGSQARTLLDGVFPTQTKKGKSLFLVRKLAYTTGTYSRIKTARYPTMRVKLNPLPESAKSHEAAVAKVINESVNKNVIHEVQYRLGKLK